MMIFKQKLSSLLLKQFNHVYNNKKASIFSFNYSNISPRKNSFLMSLNRGHSNGINNNILVDNKKAKFNKHEQSNSRNLINEWQKSKPQGSKCRDSVGFSGLILISLLCQKKS